MYGKIPAKTLGHRGGWTFTWKCFKNKTMQRWKIRQVLNVWKMPWLEWVKCIEKEKGGGEGRRTMAVSMVEMATTSRQRLRLHCVPPIQQNPQVDQLEVKVRCGAMIPTMVVTTVVVLIWIMIGATRKVMTVVRIVVVVVGSGSKKKKKSCLLVILQ